MHEDFSEILRSRSLILCSAESCQPFISKKGMDWIEATYDDVDSQIKLETIDQ